MEIQSAINIDLSEQFLHLSKAPIDEAAIEIRARAEAPWDEQSILRRLGPQLPDYPKVFSQNEIQQEFKLSIAKPPERTSQDLGWRGLRFQSADDRQIAEFNRDGFSFSRVQPYESWEQLNQEAMRLWLFHIELAKPTEINRIGLRYINRIDLPLGDRQFGDYVQPAPQPPQGLNLPFDGYFHRDTLAVPAHPYTINLIRTIQMPHDQRISGIRLILDIDVSTLQPFIPQQDLVNQRLREMRWLKNKVFFGSLTQKALNNFK